MITLSCHIQGTIAGPRSRRRRRRGTRKVHRLPQAARGLSPHNHNITRPLRDPGNPGIPGLDSNPDPGIFENKIPGFFGIWYSTQDNVFKYFY